MQISIPLRSAIEVGLNDALSHLQGDPPALASAAAGLSGLALVRLNSLAHGSEHASAVVRAAEAFASGLRATGERLMFILHGGNLGLEVLYALGGDYHSIQTKVRAAWSRAEVESFPERDELGRSLRALKWQAAVSGNPATGVRVGFEQLVRAMQGRPWAWLVAAEPCAEHSLQQEIAWLAREEREVRAEFMRPGTIEAQNNPLAERYLTALQTTRKHREGASRHGGWMVRSRLFAESADALGVGIESLHGAFAQPGEVPQPFRVWRECEGKFPVTCLNSAELAALTRPPSEDSPGYIVRAMPRFSIAPPKVTQPERLALGSILDGAQPTPAWFEIGRDELCRHAFVTGTTGSGKSTTCAWLLLQLWREHRVPFLVIEPGMNPGYAEQLAAHVPELRVLAVAPDATRRASLGRIPAEPLRLHPLAVPAGVPLGEHRDGLYTILASAFALPTPMPNVLREALSIAYRSAQGGVAHAPAFRDVVKAVDQVVQTFGYTGEVATNIRAGLTLRLAGLAFDTRGAVFAEGEDIGAAELVSRPTIIELDGLADDDDKALALGTLLLRLGHHWRSTGTNGARLRHVTLIEESHCLLSAATESPDREIANPRGRAVALFCQMLAELRAFGASFILAEQIPSKLAPDVIKNTNLKIAHRLPSIDDRDLFGGTMGLDDAQRNVLVSLDAGTAVAHSSTSTAASLIRVPNPFRSRIKRP